ncbi:MAG: nucleotidyltransferase domain-containing protein [bacterium]|nr:nucleotidyltransferase domain-containing protein [bacterium]
MQEKAINIIKEELEKKGINLMKIILFGSRARGDFNHESDWDFFVVVGKELSFQEKRSILGEIYKKLAKLEDSYEIILKSILGFEKVKNFVGSVSYEVDKEGVMIWKS